MNKPLMLQIVFFNHKFRPLKCNCANEYQWINDSKLEAGGKIAIHDTNEMGVTCTTAQRNDRCPGCGAYYWFTTGGKV